MMSAVPFDTLKYAEALEGRGIPGPTGQGPSRGAC